jgi:STE24 endopeptidase
MPKSGYYIRRYWFWFAVYAVGMGIYLWFTRSNTVPSAYQGTAADPAQFMNASELRASEIYSAQRNWLFFMLSPVEWGMYIMMLFSGWARRLQERLEKLGWWRIVRFPAYVLPVHAAAFAACLPLRFIGYVLSRHNGISTQSIPGWLKDKLIELGVGAVPLVAAIAAAMWLIRRGGRWWLKLWLLSVPLILFMMIVQPVFVDPLYNRYTRLSDPQLEAKIIEMAGKAGVPADRVYEAEMSAKTNAYNAYVNGIGPTLRIVLWDTLHRLEEEEALSIVAHEMGHYVLHHLEWSALGAVVSSLVLLGAGRVLFNRIIRKWGAVWGVRKPWESAAIPVMLLLVSILSFATLPFSNLVSRQAERAADHYGMELTGSTEGIVSMNQKLSKATLDDVFPPLLVRWFRSTHPSAMERIHDAEIFEREHNR